MAVNITSKFDKIFLRPARLMGTLSSQQHAQQRLKMSENNHGRIRQSSRHNRNSISSLGAGTASISYDTSLSNEIRVLKMCKVESLQSESETNYDAIPEGTIMSHLGTNNLKNDKQNNNNNNSNDNKDNNSDNNKYKQQIFLLQDEASMGVPLHWFTDRATCDIELSFDSRNWSKPFPIHEIAQFSIRAPDDLSILRIQVCNLYFLLGILCFCFVCVLCFVVSWEIW